MELVEIEGILIDRAVLAVPVMAILAIVVDRMWQHWAPWIAARTASELDDQLLVLLRRPVVFSILLVGLGYSLAHAGLAQPNHFIARALLLSAATVVWTGAGLRMAGVLLTYLNIHQDQWHIVQPRTLPIFEISARIILFGGGLYFLLLSWNIDVSGWLASAGIAGIAIAYASQDTLANLFAGFTILTDAPYKLDDYLVLENGMEGRVTHIGFRSTRILTLEHVEVIIPNASMASSMITNMSGGPHLHARLDVPVGVAYGSDIDLVRRLLLDVAAELSRILPPGDPAFAPTVHFVAMGASSLDLVLRVWLVEPSEHNIVLDDANTRVYKALVAHGVEIPYPKQDVYLHPPS